MTSLSQPKSLKSSDADSDRHSKPYPPSQVASHRSDDRADDQAGYQSDGKCTFTLAEGSLGCTRHESIIPLLGVMCRWANGQDM